MQLSRIAFGLCAAIAFAVAAPAVKVSAHLSPPVNVPGIDKPVIIVTGEVTGARPG